MNSSTKPDLYKLSISFETSNVGSIKDYCMYARKVDKTCNDYFVTAVDGCEYVFVKKPTSKNSSYPETYEKFKVNTKDSIYFTDLNICKEAIHHNLPIEDMASSEPDIAAQLLQLIGVSRIPRFL